MSDTTTLVVTAVPNASEMAAVQEYLQGVMPLLLGAGGSLVKRLKTEKVVHGDPSGMTLVMDFDSADSITEMFDSDDYAALVPVRDRGFKEMNILLTREMYRNRLSWRLESVTRRRGRPAGAAPNLRRIERCRSHSRRHRRRSRTDLRAQCDR